MGARVRLEFVSNGFHEVINQPGVGAAVRSAAQGIANKAGHGATVRMFRGNYGGGRPVAVVRVTKGSGKDGDGDAEFAAAKKALEGAI